MPWWHNPYAPASHDFTSAPTQRVRFGQSSGEASAAGGQLSAPTTPVPASSAPTFLYMSQPSLSSLEEPAPSDWATRSTLHDEYGQSAPAWDNRNYAQPDASKKRRRARLLPILLVSSLAVVLLLTLCVSSVASGRVGLGWLHAGSANTGSQLQTPTPDAASQPTQLPAPVSTVPSWPPVNNPQPTSTATPQPTSTASPQPSPTATSAPTDSPTLQPTATALPAPTVTPATQPTAIPQPAPTQAPDLPPVSTPDSGSEGAATP